METILCVDDEQHVLDAFHRQLHKRFHLELTSSPESAVEWLGARGPYAVVVADMRMPVMNGIQLLARAREIAPDTVRIMLTGAADFQTAITAVNEGYIFRFLAKPCPSETLANALDDGLAQYRLITAERELLEKTLKGSIRAMVDILALTNPVAFSRSMRLRHYAAQLARILHLPDIWQIEVAAMLSQVGCVTLPAEILEKAFAGESLTPQESEMYETHPQVGGQLIVQIPRMEKIAYMITHQQKPPSGARLPPETDASYLEETGAHILGMVVDLDLLLSRGLSAERARNAITAQKDKYPRPLLKALAAVEVPKLEKTGRMASIVQLRDGMILAEDIRTRNGVLVVQKDQEINDTLRQRLINFQMQNSIPNEVRVFVHQRHFKDP